MAIGRRPGPVEGGGPGRTQNVCRAVRPALAREFERSCETIPSALDRLVRTGPVAGGVVAIMAVYTGTPGWVCVEPVTYRGQALLQLLMDLGRQLAIQISDKQHVVINFCRPRYHYLDLASRSSF